MSRATGNYLDGGRVVQVRDLLTDTSLSVAGRELGGDPKKGLVLLRVDGPLRADHITTGIDYPDLWAAHAAMYRGFACRGGRLAVRLGSDPHLFKSAQLVEAYVRGRFVGSALVAPDRAGAAFVLVNIPESKPANTSVTIG